MNVALVYQHAVDSRRENAMNKIANEAFTVKDQASNEFAPELEQDKSKRYPV